MIFMKTEELNALTDEELVQVSGGVESICSSGGGGYPCSATPSAPSMPSTPMESYTVPVKGEDTVHIDT